MLRGLFIVICFTAICISEVPAQIVFEYEECECDNTIYPEARINGEKKGVVLVYSEVDNLRFEMHNAKSERLLDVKHKDGKYILILEPIDEPFRKAYGKYDILVKATGFQERHIYVKKVNPGSMCSFCCILRSPVDSPKDRLARITVYDMDNKVLVGAEVKEKTTGKVYGSTRFDGTVAVGFERKGETTEVIVSHPSYSDTVELIIQSGVHDYKVYLHNINTKPAPESTREQKRYNHNNTLAFFESAILPGLGQWRKGYAGHGLANMLGEAALISGAVYYYNSAQKISNQGLIDTGIVAVYNRNITAYNVFVGAAIALYAFNLLQAVIIKPQDDHNIAMTPSLFPVGNTLTPSISLTFNF